MTQIDELKAFTETGAFAGLSTKAQQEVLDQISRLEAQRQEQETDAIVQAIVRSVAPLAKETTLEATFRVDIANGQVVVSPIARATAPRLRTAYSSGRCREAVLKAFLWLSEHRLLDRLAPYISQKGNRPERSLNRDGVFALPNILLASDLDDVRERNVGTSRWFTHEFYINGTRMFLSNQWRDKVGQGLQLPVFNQLLKTVYPGTIVIEKENKTYYVRPCP